MKRVILATVVGLAVSAGAARAQINEPTGGRLQFEVFDAASGTWQSNVTVAPAARVEWRVTVSYTGSNTGVYALSSVLYQPTWSNVDNTTAGGVDELLPWRNGGVQGQSIIDSPLTVDEGASGAALASYGRVRVAATSMHSLSQNILTTHRHGGDFAAAGAPAGSWLRVAGSFVTTWPRASLPTTADATATNLNSINRGVISNQLRPSPSIPIVTSTWFLPGTQQIVIFRGALQLSDLADARTLELTSPAGTQQRVGGVNDGNDTRFMVWHLNNSDAGWRVGVQTVTASITVIPGPATLAGVGLFALITTRRSRVRTCSTV